MIVSRFAPAPTGFLHLGHVVNALHVWGVARAAGGQVRLRIEDHDRQRSRRDYERAMLDDLAWLGFEPDVPRLSAFNGPVPDGRQSDRGAVYDAALERLRALGRVYVCDCSRAAILDGAPASGELRYSGRCRERGLADAPGRSLRLRLDPTVEAFDDLRHGLLRQQPSAQCGDLLLRDRLGNWTYQFAVTVDDLDQGVTLVIRGDDLLASTGRQIQLARLLGRTRPPRFLHHGLIMKSATQKLSKADRDTSVRDRRAAGATAADILGEAAAAIGLTASAARLELPDVMRLPVLVGYARRLASVTPGG